MMRAEIDLEHGVRCHSSNLERPASLTFLEEAIPASTSRTDTDIASIPSSAQSCGSSGGRLVKYFIYL
jgi:hypothetical protein